MHDVDPCSWHKADNRLQGSCQNRAHQGLHSVLCKTTHAQALAAWVSQVCLQCPMLDMSVSCSSKAAPAGHARLRPLWNLDPCRGGA